MVENETMETEVTTANLKTLAEVEKTYVLTVMSLMNQNKTHAARALGISRRGLLNKLNTWKVEDYEQEKATQ